MSWKWNKQPWGAGSGGGAWWSCTDADCRKAAGVKWNKPALTQCHYCHAPRQAGAIESEAAKVRLREKVAAKPATGGGANEGAKAAPVAQAEEAKPPRLTKKQRKAANKLRAEKLLEEKVAAAIAQNGQAVAAKAPAEDSAEFEVGSEMEDCFGKSVEVVPPTKEEAKRLALLGLPLAPAGDLDLLYRIPSGTELQTPDAVVAKALEGEAAEAVAT